MIIGVAASSLPSSRCSRFRNALRPASRPTVSPPQCSRTAAVATSRRSDSTRWRPSSPRTPTFPACGSPLPIATSKKGDYSRGARALHGGARPGAGERHSAGAGRMAHLPVRRDRTRRAVHRASHQIEPDFPQAYWYLANVRIQMDDPAGAIEPLERLLAYDLPPTYEHRPRRCWWRSRS